MADCERASLCWPSDDIAFEKFNFPRRWGSLLIDRSETMLTRLARGGDGLMPKRESQATTNGFSPSAGTALVALEQLHGNTSRSPHGGYQEALAAGANLEPSPASRPGKVRVVPDIDPLSIMRNTALGRPGLERFKRKPARELNDLDERFHGSNLSPAFLSL